MNDVRHLNTAPLPVRLRAADYLMLDRSGAFDRYSKTELLEGELFYMNAQHRPHARLKMALYDALRDRLRHIGSDLTPLVEASVALGQNSVPEPDIVLTREPQGEGLVPLASVALIVEVADATLDSDLTRKARLYAEAGIAEYWVADVQSGAIHQMWRPSDGRYAERTSAAAGATMGAETIDDLVIRLPS